MIDVSIVDKSNDLLPHFVPASIVARGCHCVLCLGVCFIEKREVE